VVLVVAALTASELGAGVAMGSFCKDADTNTLTAIHHFGDGLAYNVSRYYITGEGSNALTDELQHATATVALIGQQLGATEVRRFFVQECGAPAAPDSLASLIASTSGPLHSLDTMLSPAHVYPYYRSAVHESACTTMVSGLGWLIVSQIAVGLLFLPVLSCMADSFFSRWVVWRAQSQVSPWRHPDKSDQCVV